MRRILSAVLLAALVLPARAQSNLSESVEVHVLELEAVVLDREGKPVRGLTRDDFTVKIDGKSAEVTNFFAVDRGAVVETRDPSSTAAEAETPVVRIPSRLIVVLDDLHLHQKARKRALDAMKTYVENAIAESTTVTIVRWNGSMKTVVRPTADRQELQNAIAGLEREPAGMIRADSERIRAIRQIDDVILHPSPIGQDSQASQAMANAATYVRDRTREVEITLKALAELITLMSGLEGRKIVLYVSEGLAQQPGVDVFEYAREVFTRNPIEGFDLAYHTGGSMLDDSQDDQTRPFRKLASLAQSAGVVFSSLDPGGLRVDEGSGAEYATMLARLDASFIRHNESAGPRVIAAETGGRYITNENDLHHAISVLTDDVTTYYSLGVRPPDKRSSESSSVVIRVKNRDDVRVLTPRRHAVKSEKEAMASAIRARMYSREESNPLGVQLTVGAAWPRGERCVAPVQLIVPAEKLAPLPDGELSVHAVVIDDRGLESSVRSSTHPITPTSGAPQRITFDFGLKPRRYVLSLAVKEKATGETSYLQTDVDATICGR